jgi:hypothetical protein
MTICSKGCSKRGRRQAPGPPVFALLLALAWLANGETASAAACVWTGGGTNNNWSSAGNWTSCGGVASQNGDSLSFPNGAARAINFNDLTGLSVASINVAGVGAGGQAWSITGNAVTLNGPLGIGAQYLLASGAPITVSKTVAANGRLTVNIKDEVDPRLRAAPTRPASACPSPGRGRWCSIRSSGCHNEARSIAPLPVEKRRR